MCFQAPLGVELHVCVLCAYPAEKYVELYRVIFERERNLFELIVVSHHSLAFLYFLHPSTSTTTIEDSS